jgi:hypothetical protein
MTYLADITGKLETALTDTSNAVWSSAELNDILTVACARIARDRQRVVRDSIDLVDDQETYTLTNVYTAQRVDLLDSDGYFVMKIPDGAWEIWGDQATAGQTLFINRRYANSNYSLRVHGYAPYDLVTNTPTANSTFEGAILALARVEALRRIEHERSRYQQWANTNPRGNTSVNELLNMIREAEAEANALRAEIRLIIRPMPGKSGP